MKDVAKFLEWIAQLGPTLVSLFTATKGDSKAAIAVMKAAYKKISDEQDAELARQKARRK